MRPEVILGSTCFPVTAERANYYCIVHRRVAKEMGTGGKEINDASALVGFGRVRRVGIIRSAGTERIV